MRYRVEVCIDVIGFDQEGESGRNYCLYQSPAFDTDIGARYLASRILEKVKEISETEGAREQQRREQLDHGR